MLTVAVLGPVEARRDGVRLEVPAGKTTELLARLALAAGAPVRVDVLLEDLWAQPTARNTLQSKISQLRRALGREIVVTSGDAYVLALPTEAVDASRVAELASSSAAARAAGDPATALDRALDALALFRGDALPDAGDWATAERARLEEVRLSLLECAVSARVALGAGGEIVAELEALVDRFPFREGLWAALITAQYRAGRQADALATFARARRLLLDELGVEPGPALQALERQVLRQSPELTTGIVPMTGSPGNVPHGAEPMLGRDRDVAAVLAAVAQHRLVSVLGPGGVGKTRVGIEVARRLSPPGGVWLVRLDAVEDGSDLFQVVAETLHVPGGAQSLQQRLTGAPTVLLLDNCEHLLASTARLVESVLDAAPLVTVLATSQAPLGLADEHSYVLAPLSQEHSVELFGRRARDARRGLVIDPDTAVVVEEVCRSLDGLPLAIELAAARVRSLSIRDIARRLDDRFALLRDPSSTRPERRRALAGAIAWSYELLFPDDQRGLWALSCFAGGATLDAAEHVMSALGVPGEAVLDTITRLVDRSLVGVDADADGEVRYRLLDSIRTYAAERLRDSGQSAVAAAAHADWYGQTAAWCGDRVLTDAQPACLAVARAERANVDAALAWCARHDPLLGMRIANGFGWTWVVLGDGTSGAARVRNALVDAAPARDRAAGSLLAAWLEASAGNVDVAQADLDQARALASELDDDILVADVERHQAFLALQQGRPGLAVASAAISLGTYRDRGLAWHTAASLLLGAFGSLMLGDTEAAARDATEAVRILTPLGDAWGLVHGQAMLGAIAQGQHRLADAADALERAADDSVRLGFPGQAALHRATLARAQHRAGDPRAGATYLRAIAEATAGGDGRLAATARLNLARLRRESGDADEALALLTENQRWYAAAGGGDFALLSRCLLAAVRDDSAELAAVLTQARVAGNVEVEVHALDALARLAADAGRPEVARNHLAAADRLAPQVAHLLDQRDRLDGNAARRRLG